MRRTQQPIALVGQVAVITGGSRGIGRAIAERYGRAGAKIVIAGVDPERAAATAAALQTSGIAALGVACDVRSREAVLALRARALAEWGKIDIWVNNAGIAGPFAATLDVDPAVWEDVIATNLLGTYHGTCVALEQMLAQGHGRIINLSGGGATRAQRFLSAYSTTKAAIVRMSEGFARDYVNHKAITINVLTPGIVPTDMTDFKLAESQGEAAEALKQFPRIMRIFGTTAEETAELALHMVGPQTAQVSGKVFEVMPRHRALWRIGWALVKRA